MFDRTILLPNGRGSCSRHRFLPGTRAALRDGTLSLGKARIIVNATGLLDEAEARAAEAEVLDRTGRLTPGGLRAAIARGPKCRHDHRLNCSTPGGRSTSFRTGPSGGPHVRANPVEP